MLEAFLLAGYVFIFSPLFLYLEVPPVIIFIGMIIISIPGFIGMVTGAPFVPTTKKTLKKMIDIADIQTGDKAFDLGCGDGRIVFAAAKAGAHATGYEVSVPTYILAKFKSLFNQRSEISIKNFWSQDYKDADVIFCFLLTETMQKFYDRIWPDLKPGCKVVSHAFKMKQLEPAARVDNVVMYIK